MLDVAVCGILVDADPGFVNVIRLLKGNCLNRKCRFAVFIGTFGQQTGTIVQCDAADISRRRAMAVIFASVVQDLYGKLRFAFDDGALEQWARMEVCRRTHIAIVMSGQGREKVFEQALRLL